MNITDETIRDYVRDQLRDEGDLLTDFIVVAGYVSADGSDGVIVTTSDGSTGYSVRGLLATATDIYSVEKQ